MTLLGSLVTKVESASPKGLDFLYVDLASVNADEKRIDKARVVPIEEAPSRARLHLQENDVLVSTVRPNLNGVSIVPRDLNGAIGSTGFCVLRADRSKLEPSYLFHWARSSGFIDSMTRLATGASYPAVSDAIVKGSDIPLPPLPEQRRIASILDQADGLRAVQHQAIGLVQSSIDSLFVHSFGDPLATSRRDDARSLASIAEAIVDCPHTTPSWTESGALCLRTSNLGGGEWNWSETRYVSEDTHTERVKRAELEPGDIVLSREGTIGVAAAVPIGMRASLGQRLVQIRPDYAAANTQFLLGYLLEVLKPERLTKLLVGSTSRHLNVKDLRALSISVPSLPTQVEFAKRSDELRSHLVRSRERLTLLNELFASLQHRAFTGQL